MDAQAFLEQLVTTDVWSSTFETVIDGYHDVVLIDECPSSAKASTDGCNDGEVPPDGC